MNTLVVNCYGGPGAGKTACAWDVAAALKKKGINVEYVPEAAKEYVWEGRLEVLEDQERLFKEQSARLERLRGKVEVIVTDSPILLSHIYGKNNSHEFSERIDAEYNSWYNFNLFIKREGEFHQEGRIQNLEESKEIDKKIIKMLADKDIFYGTYSYENLKYLAENIIINLEKIQKLKEKKNEKRRFYNKI
ncbi:MAG: AAA family ATPase [Alphaproteobacteria bacterium]|nr:AAA family ATPase [Alphaproteobacteria bacterium]